MPAVARKSGSHEIVSRRRRSTPEEIAAERELIRRCRAGARDAQEQLYAQHRRQVAATLYRVLNNRTDLDDLVQEVFVIAFRGLDAFRGEARLSTWLHRICVNVALGAIRQRKRRPPPVLSPQPIDESTHAPDETPEEALTRTRARDRVYRVLASLPAKKRIVLYLHEIEGLDLKEIAYAVDAHPVTVRTRLYYARKEFYALLAEQPDDAEDAP